jgi:hypothetical protein
MADLSTIDFSKEPEQVIVFGPPKSGKTELVSKLAHSHTLWWFDLENGGRTLAKLPQEVKKNVKYFRIFDTPDAPNAIETALKVITGAAVTFCEEHGKVSCAACLTARKPMETVQLSKLDPAKDIVVWDSLTQLTSSAINKITQQFNIKIEAGKKFEFDHWNMLQVYLNKFLQPLQNAPWNNICISHETALKLEDGTDKLVPSGGTENYSRNVARFFGQVVYVQVINLSHKASSSTTAQNKVLTGSRTDVEVDITSLNPLEPIFNLVKADDKQPAAASPVATVATKAVNPALQAMLAKAKQ